MKLNDTEFLDVLKSYFVNSEITSGKLTDSVSSSVNLSIQDGEVVINSSLFDYNKYIEYITYNLIFFKNIAFVLRLHTNQVVDGKPIDEIYAFMIDKNESGTEYKYTFFSAEHIKNIYVTCDDYLVFCDKNGERLTNWL